MATSRHHNTQQQGGGDVEFIKLLDEDQPLRKFNCKKYNQFIEYNTIDRVKRIKGSLIGLAVGDALGASVEFRPYEYLQQNEVKDMLSGGTWGLEKGYWTDDTSMTLCLAASLIVRRKFDPYDQFERYRRWYRNGYMSSTGKCFDIGKSTRDAITQFERLYQNAEDELRKEKIDRKRPDFEERIKEKLRNIKSGLQLGAKDAAGNGPLMRLAPLPCFFCDSYDDVKKYIKEATLLTHGDEKAVDACVFYSGLIWYALQGKTKNELLNKAFYKDVLKLKLHSQVKDVAEGSYMKKKGYADGIRGKGYVVNSLEAALWAFYNDNNDFEIGVLKAVNLGDDTDTTAAIYGALAGAVYGIEKIPDKWIKLLYGRDFILAIANNLYAVNKPLEKNQQWSNWDENNDDPKDYGDGTYQSRHERSTSTEAKSGSNTNNETKTKSNNQSKHNDEHRTISTDANATSRRDSEHRRDSDQSTSSNAHNNDTLNNQNNKKVHGDPPPSEPRDNQTSRPAVITE